MPILVMAVVALGLFILIGLMLFSATWAEKRERRREQAAGAALPPAEEPESAPAKKRTAHA
jgi:hypothetical protein